MTQGKYPLQKACTEEMLSLGSSFPVSHVGITPNPRCHVQPPWPASLHLGKSAPCAGRKAFECLSSQDRRYRWNGMCDTPHELMISFPPPLRAESSSMRGQVGNLRAPYPKPNFSLITAQGKQPSDNEKNGLVWQTKHQRTCKRPKMILVSLKMGGGLVIKTWKGQESRAHRKVDPLDRFSLVNSSVTRKYPDVIWASQNRARPVLFGY